MEKKDDSFTLTEAEFVALLARAYNHDHNAILKLLYYFEPEMVRLSRYIQMPEEDALQSMRLCLIEQLKTKK